MVASLITGKRRKEETEARNKTTRTRRKQMFTNRRLDTFVVAYSHSGALYCSEHG